MAAKKGNRGERLQQTRGGVSGKVTQTFDAASPSHLHSFVVGAIRIGALVSFSRTSDGGAVVVTILDEELPDGKLKEYYANDEEIAEAIEFFAGVYGDA